MLITLFRFLSFFPLPFLHGIGASLGWLIYLVSPSYRHRLQENIRQAGYTEHTSRAVSEAGKSVFELPFVWYGSPKRVLSSVQTVNDEVTQKALAAHQGVIFLTPHLGCFEITPQTVAIKEPMTILYRPPRKKVLQPIMEDARNRPNLKLAPANLAGVRAMLKALKRGEAVGLLPDQVPQRGEGVWADFFGRPAYTMTLSFKLHRMTGAPIILAYGERLPFGRGYVVHHFPLVPFCDPAVQSKDVTPEQEARTINLAMEKLIARCPAQYLWSYNRYKIPAHAAALPVSTSE